ncbi:MAG: CHASE2 domain-containing protein, partial [Candidatus Competibacter sp.]
MSKLQSSSMWPATLVASLAFGLVLILSNTSFFALLELKGLDLLFTLRGALPPPPSIVIVAIDEPSMAEIKQQWPWPRSLHARLIRQLHQAGAAVIGFDVLFAEPSEPAEDQALAQALREAGNGVLTSALSVVNDPLFRHTIRVDPIPALQDAALVGSAFISIDPDGAVRRARLLAPDLPSFALQMVRRYLERPTAVAPEGPRFSQHDLLRERLIDYRGPPKTIQTVSYYQAIDPQRLLPSGIFAGKIVLVGRVLEAIPEPQRLSGDTFLTPFSWTSGNPAAGVEIQATLVDNLLNGRFVAELTPAER